MEKMDKKERSEALNSAMKQIEKQFGKGTVMRLGENKSTFERNVVSTGILPLDMAVGIGGLPRGRIIEVYGPESSGKTTVALQMIAEMQRQGGTAAFIDAEHAFDAFYAKQLGIDVETLIFSQPDFGEQGLEIVDSLIRSAAIDMVVIDSVAALVPQAEIDGDMGASHVGLHARMMSQAMRKLAGTVSKTETIAIFINQIREKVGVMFGNPETTTGGRALKFYSTIRMEVRKGEPIKEGANIVGNRVKVKITKNKVAPPLKQVEFDLLYGTGFSILGSIIDMSVEKGIIARAGAYYNWNGERFQGKERFREYLQRNPEKINELEAEVRKTLINPSEIDIPKEEVIEEMPEDYDGSEDSQD